MRNDNDKKSPAWRLHTLRNVWVRQIGPRIDEQRMRSSWDMKKSQAMRDGDPIRQITKMLKLDEPNQQGAMSNLSLDLTWREV